MYSTCTAIVAVVYADTLTRGVGDRVVVRVRYAYCHSYYGVRGYSDKGVGDRVVVRVRYVYSHSYYGVRGYSDKGGRG